MNTVPDPRDFLPRDEQKEELLEASCKEDDTCKPSKEVLQDFDIQSADTQEIPITYAGNIETWLQLNEEKIRQSLVLRLMRLFELWVIAAWIVFIVNGNVWPLTTAGLLGTPIAIMLGYYFYRSQQK